MTNSDQINTFLPYFLIFNKSHTSLTSCFFLKEAAPHDFSFFPSIYLFSSSGHQIQGLVNARQVL